MVLVALRKIPMGGKVFIEPGNLVDIKGWPPRNVAAMKNQHWVEEITEDEAMRRGLLAKPEAEEGKKAEEAKKAEAISPPAETKPTPTGSKKKASSKKKTS